MARKTFRDYVDQIDPNANKAKRTTTTSSGSSRSKTSVQNDIEEFKRELDKVAAERDARITAEEQSKAKKLAQQQAEDRWTETKSALASKAGPATSSAVSAPTRAEMTTQKETEQRHLSVDEPGKKTAANAKAAKAAREDNPALLGQRDVQSDPTRYDREHYDPNEGMGFTNHYSEEYGQRLKNRMDELDRNLQTYSNRARIQGASASSTQADLWRTERDNLQEQYNRWERDMYTAAQQRALAEISDDDLALIDRYYNNNFRVNASGGIQYVDNPEDTQRQLREDRQELLDRFGREKMNSLLEYRGRQLDEQRQAAWNAELARRTERYGAASAVAGNIGSVLTNAVAGPMAALDIVGQAFNPNRHAPLNTNSPGFAAQNVTQAIRGKTSDMILGDEENPNLGRKIGNMLYQTGMSAADSVAAMAVGGRAGGALLGINAATSAAQDITERGGSYEQAVTGGIASGIFESLFETVSIGNFYKLQETAVHGIRDVLGNMAKSGIVNLSEEALTEVANILYDTAVLGDLSNYQIRLREMMSQGLSEDEAKQQLARELGMQVAESGASGAIMGLFFGAAGSGMSYADGRARSQSVAQPAALEPAGAELFRQEQAAEQRQIQAAQETERAQREAMQAEAARQAAEDEARRQAEMRQQAEQEVVRQAEARRQTEAQVAQQGTPPLEVEGTELFEQNASSQNSPIENPVNAAYTGINQTAQHENGGTEYGRGEDVLLPRSGERNDGTSSSRQSGTVASVPAANPGRQTDRGGSQIQRALARQNRVNAQRGERISSRSLGFARGTDTARNAVISQDLYDEEMTATAERVMRETGMGVIYFTGRLELAGRNGKTYLADGAVRNGRMYLRADSAKTPISQLANHETFHEMVRTTPGLLETVRENILQRFDAAELDSIAAQYAEATGGIYDAADEEIARDLIFEEIAADAYAGMNRFGTNASQYGEIAREEVGRRTGNRVGSISGDTRYIAAGEKALTADIGRLSTAKDLAEQGVGNKEIYQKTGWYRGGDNKWRFEIDDSAMEFYRFGNAHLKFEDPEYAYYLKLSDKVKSVGGSTEEKRALRSLGRKLDPKLIQLHRNMYRGTATLKDMIDHPQLFETYPELRDVRVQFVKYPSGEYGGYNPKTNLIQLDESLLWVKTMDELMQELDDTQNGVFRPIQYDALRNVLIHEIQHAVQHIEGHAQGASSLYWEQRQRAQAQTGDDQYADRSPMELYFDTYGEQEAEDTMFRRTMTQEQRMAYMPFAGNKKSVFADNKRYYISDTDSRYLELAKDPDTNHEELQRLVDEAANAAMPSSKIRDENNNLIRVYHGTSENLTVFDRTKARGNMDIQGSFFNPWEIDAGGYGGNVKVFYLNITNPAPKSVAYKAMKRYRGQNDAGIKARVYLESLGYDGVDNGGEEYIAFDPFQIKSADPVTYDDAGNVILLSGRFNRASYDSRYAITDEEDDTRYLELARDPEANRAELQQMVDEAAEAAGYTVHAYHGTGRADRVGYVFLPERATSGPMAFFTDDPQIAENYARDKRDTSMYYDDDYSSYYTQFRTTRNGESVAIGDIWKSLTRREQQRITEAGRHITWDEDMERPVYDSSADRGLGNWDSYLLREHKGNAIEALTDSWLESGELYNQEEMFLDVLKLAGIEDVEYRNPDARYEKVYNAVLAINNPFVTSDADEQFANAFEAWYAEQDEDRYARVGNSADMWDKNNLTADQWLERLSSDIQNGTTYAWTSIPDSVSDFLRSQNYDGIKDDGGKFSGQHHTVWIPFESSQVKSADPVTYDDAGNVIPLSERFNAQNDDIRYAMSGRDDDTAADVDVPPLEPDGADLFDDYDDRGERWDRDGNGATPNRGSTEPEAPRPSVPGEKTQAQVLREKSEQKIQDNLQRIAREDFRPSKALEKIGVRVEGTVTQEYSKAEGLRVRDDANKALQRWTRRAEQRLRATPKEKNAAAALAAGIYTEEDIPSTLDKNRVMELAEYYMDLRAIGEDMIRAQKTYIDQDLDYQMRQIFRDVDESTKKKPKMLSLNYNTAQRNMRSIFGDELGNRINKEIFDPVNRNEAERLRWMDKQFDLVRTFEDKNGKKRRLTRAESALVQMVIEGKAIGEQVASMEMGGAIRDAAENLLNGGDPADIAREFHLTADERKMAERYARWTQTQEALKSGKVDAVKIENAAKKYAGLFNDYYDAINDFLVVHGYEPIGFINGYAPHMQSEETVSALNKALQAFGIQTDVTELDTGIAGRTKDFRPNKRWNPFFLSRTGDTTTYDIESAFESYIDYLSDVLYHTDDIMRLRQMNKYFRRTYGSEETRNNIEHAEYLQGMSAEEKASFLRDVGKLDRTSILSNADINQKMDDYIAELYEQIGKTTQFGNLVMWLDNYTNVLAGKQNSFDRAMEEFLGRRSLNFGRKLTQAFARAQVAGNVSSVLNQAAQLPMIFAEKGARNTAHAMVDILSGKLKKADFAQESDFLTGKKGVDYLVHTPMEMVTTALFKPAEFMDGIVSTLAVRSAYLDAVKKGQSHEEAMRTADQYGTEVMASRLKGAKPNAFTQKNFIMQAVNMFQIEAINSWEHVARDLPRDFREIERSKGRGKAALALAGVLIKALLSAFVLNRIDEELYGGSPAPFDLLGLSANFIASGEGLTTNDYIRTIIDNGWERVTGERIFGTDELDDEREFDTETALEDLGYNVSNEVPYVRNVSGLLGWGDQSLPLPDLYGGIKDIYDSSMKNGFLSGETAEAGANLLFQTLPGGRQISKTYQGARTMANGGRVKGFGDNKRMLYPVEDSVGNWVRALMFGNSGLLENARYYASGSSGYTTGQTQSAQDMIDSGMDAGIAYGLIDSLKGKGSDAERYAAIRDADLDDAEKAQVYSRFTTRQAYGKLLDAGIEEETAQQIAWQLGGLDPEGDTDDVSDAQMYGAIIDMDIGDDDKELAISTIMQDSSYDKLQTLLDSGVTLDQWYDFYTYNKLPGTNQEENAAFIDRMRISDKQKDAMWFYAGYKETTLEKKAPWHQ